MLTVLSAGILTLSPFISERELVFAIGYRPSICLSLCWSVCLSVTFVRPI